MLDATDQTIRARVNKLRAEIAEVSRLNEEYLHINHTLQVKEAQTERRNPLEQIVTELSALFKLRWNTLIAFDDCLSKNGFTHIVLVTLRGLCVRGSR